MTTKKQEDPVKKLSKLINQSSFKFNKDINSFFDDISKNMKSLFGPSKISNCAAMVFASSIENSGPPFSDKFL